MWSSTATPRRVFDDLGLQLCASSPSLRQFHAVHAGIPPSAARARYVQHSRADVVVAIDASACHCADFFLQLCMQLFAPFCMQSWILDDSTIRSAQKGCWGLGHAPLNARLERAPAEPAPTNARPKSTTCDLQCIFALTSYLCAGSEDAAVGKAAIVAAQVPPHHPHGTEAPGAPPYLEPTAQGGGDCASASGRPPLEGRRGVVATAEHEA